MYNPRALYSVKSTVLGEDFEFLGIDVKIGTDPDGRKWIGFHDTGRGHQIEGDIVEELPDGFVWRRKNYNDDGTWEWSNEKLTFRILTLDRFKKDFVEKGRIAGAEVFLDRLNSDLDLWEWYRREYGSRGFAF